LADVLIRRFGSLGALLAARTSARRRLLAGWPEVAAFLDTVRDCQMQTLSLEHSDAPILVRLSETEDYLYARMAFEPREQLRVMYLSAVGRLIADEVSTEGSISEVAIFPREIIKRALDLDATKLILAHNHPSGDATPSDEDLAQTRNLIAAGAYFGITVFDHVIVARLGCVSFRDRGLLR
jgi:DNA repair protein RadC